MAVAVNKETSVLMNQTFAEVCVGNGTFNAFFSGHSDSEEEGRWRDVNTGDLLTWGHWADGEPSGGETQQCSMIMVSDGDYVSAGQIFDWICSLLFVNIFIFTFQR